MISEILKESVMNKDLIAVRAALQSKILLDHDLISGGFNECLQYCLENGISERELYVPFSSADPISDEVSLENFNTMYSYLGINFAKERVECIKKIAAALWPAEQKQVPQKESKSIHCNEEKQFVNGQRVVSVSEREIVPQKVVVGKKEDSSKSSRPQLKPNERIISVEEREVHVKKRGSIGYSGHNPGFGAFKEDSPVMTNEIKTLLAIGAIVIVVAATAFIVTK